MNKKSEVINNTQITSVTMQEQQFIGDLKHIVQTARNHSYRAANLMQVASNWLIGWRIVEQEKQGKQKADYGTYIVRLAAESLTREFGAGYSQTNVKNFVRFYNTFRQFAIGQTLPDLSQTSLQQIGQTMPDLSLILQIQKQLPIQLSWSHYERLIRVTDHEARLWYMNEAATQQWDYRTLRRNISSQYYYRLIQTPEAHRPQVEQEMQQLTSAYQQPQSAFIKLLHHPHKSLLANPLLAEPMYLSGLIEKMGTGTEDIIRECTAYGLSLPEFHQEFDFRTIIWRKKREDDTKDDTKDDANELTERQRYIVELISSNDTITIEEMIQKTKKSSITIKRDLATLQQKGYIIRKGGRKEGQWIVMK